MLLDGIVTWSHVEVESARTHASEFVADYSADAEEDHLMTTEEPRDVHQALWVARALVLRRRR
jgi:hypothetical protein